MMRLAAWLVFFSALPAYGFELGASLTVHSVPLCRDAAHLVRAAEMYEKSPAKGLTYIRQRARFVGSDGRPGCFIAVFPMHVTIVGYLQSYGDDASLVAVKYALEGKEYLAVMLIEDKPEGEHL